MKYAVLDINGKQYKAAEGEEFLVDKITGEPKVEVMLMVEGDNVKIGNPVIKGASAKLKLIDAEVKGKKVTAQTFKAKARIRKKIGMRPLFTRFKLESLSVK